MDIRKVYEETRSLRKTAKICGVSRDKVQAVLDAPPEETKRFTLPELPAEEMSYSELVGHMVTRYKRKDDHNRAKKWREVNINIEGPVCLVGVGDPHVDDDGCNWPLLKQHVEHLNEEGMLPINIGDTNNNWIGRLARLYSKQNTTEAQAWILVEGFLKSVPWLAVLQGNHGMWSGAGSPVNWIVDNRQIIVENWRTDFEMVFKNSRVKVTAAHDLPGHSMWNETHGPLRAAKMGGQADIYICGHKHCFGEQIVEQYGKLIHVSRARGYKRYDEYAEVNGFSEGDYGTSVCYLIDPDAPIEERIIFVPSLKKASQLLRLMRADWKKGKKK